MKKPIIPCFPYSAQSPLKGIDVGSTNCLLVQLMPPNNYSVREKYKNPYLLINLIKKYILN